MMWYTIYAAETDRLEAYGTVYDCARTLGCTAGSVRCMISRTKSGRNLAHTIVAEDLDTGGYAVYGADNRGGHKRFDRAAVLALYERGLADREIAKGVGIHPKTVLGWRKENGLPSNGKRGRRAAAKEAQR